MISYIDTIIMAVLQIPPNILVGCLDLSYLLILACLMLLFTQPAKQKQHENKMDEYCQTRTHGET